MTQASRQADRAVSDRDEVALIERVARRDRPAFESLYRLYFVRLRRFLDKMIREPALIDEVLDDTMLAVWERAGTFDGTCRVSTWIFAVAYRQGLKALGKERRHANDAEPGEEALADLPCDEPGPEAILFAAQSRRLLDRLLGLLSAEQRAVVELTYFHDRGYAEISEIAGCPEGTVKTRMFHARRKLRELLIQEGWRAE